MLAEPEGLCCSASVTGAFFIASKEVAGRENARGQRADRRRKRQKGTEHARNASILKISGQDVMQDQGLAWSKLYCLKSSFLALTTEVDENWLKRPQRKVPGVFCNDTWTLYHPLGAPAVRERNEREPTPIDRGESAKRRLPTLGKPDRVTELP